MAFDWDNFLILAASLSRVANSEAARRTAANRAYYAMFHLAGEHATLKGKVGGYNNNRGASHSSLAQWYKNRLGDVDYQEVGDKLQTMRLLRERCDYSKNKVEDLERNLTLIFSEAEDIKRILSEHEAS